MNISKENLQVALIIAIDHQRLLEKQMGRTMKSALLQGWEDVLLSIEQNKEVKIK